MGAVLNYYCSMPAAMHGVTRVNRPLLARFPHVLHQPPHFNGSMASFRRIAHRYRNRAAEISHALDIRDTLVDTQIVTVHDLIPWLYPIKNGPKLKLWHALLLLSFSRNLRHAEKVVATGPQAKHDLEAVGLPCTDTIGNVLDPRLATKKHRMRRNARYLLVGSNDPRKRWEDAIRAAAARRASITWIGHRILSPFCDEYEARLMQLAARLHVSVERLPDASENQLALAYNTSQAMLVSSPVEGYNLPIIEALYFGCPVYDVTTQVGNGYLQRNLGGLIPPLGHGYDVGEKAAKLNDRLGCYDVSKHLEKWRTIYAAFGVDD